MTFLHSGSARPPGKCAQAAISRPSSQGLCQGKSTDLSVCYDSLTVPEPVQAGNIMLARGRNCRDAAGACSVPMERDMRQDSFVCAYSCRRTGHMRTYEAVAGAGVNFKATPFMQ